MCKREFLIPVFVSYLERLHCPGYGIDYSDSVIIRIGNVEFAVGSGQAARFVELGLRDGTISEACFARTRDRVHFARARIEGFQAIVIGVGQVDQPVERAHGLDVLKLDIIAGPVDIAEVEEASANQRAHSGHARQVERAYSTGLAIGNIEHLPMFVDAQAGRLREPGVVPPAVE